MKKNTVLATLAALLAQIIFGFSFMFTKISLRYATPMTVIADRYIIAFIGLSVLLIFKKTKLSFTKNIWKLLLMSIFQPVLYFLFETYGIKMTTSAFSSVMISLIPVVSMIMGVFFLKEIPSVMQYVFAFLSVCGVAIMALSGNADGSVTPFGVLLLFGAVLSSVAYNISSRKISKEFSVMERTYSMTIIGLLIFMCIAYAENIDNPVNIIINFKNSSYTYSILYLGLASSVFAFMFLNYANTYLPVAKTTVFANITTIVSVFAGAIFIDEKLTLEVLLSTLMIVIGVWGVQSISVKKKE